MNGNNSMTETPVSERLSDSKLLAMQWKTIDWKKAEQEVNRLQVRIVKATQEKKWNTVKRLQYLLTHSFHAKALAVRRVTTNKGKKTAGIDGEIWSTPAMKMRAVLSLTDKNYTAKPLRRVYIEKKDKKKKRPLGIPTMYDRAMQALYASQWQKQPPTRNHLVSGKDGAVRTLANISLRHCHVKYRPNGY